jgi:hypothetical protein
MKSKKQSSKVPSKISALIYVFLEGMYRYKTETKEAVFGSILALFKMK